MIRFWLILNCKLASTKGFGIHLGYTLWFGQVVSTVSVRRSLECHVYRFLTDSQVRTDSLTDLPPTSSEVVLTFLTFSPAPVLPSLDLVLSIHNKQHSLVHVCWVSHHDDQFFWTRDWSDVCHGFYDSWKTNWVNNLSTFVWISLQGVWDRS